MRYEDFREQNLNMKLKVKVPRMVIDRVSLKEGKCYFMNGESHPIKTVVQSVMEGKIAISNPSKLSTWSGFNEGPSTPKVSNQKAQSVKKVVSKYPFELVEREPHQVIIRVVANDNLTIAKNPYISSKMDYITVTRGEKHILTVINKDGTTFSFHWGSGGYTLISESTERLKKAVVAFIEEDNHISLEWDDGRIDSASIFYNQNFNSWQLTLRGNRNGRTCEAFIRDKNSNNVEDMIQYSRYYLNVAWEKGKAQTGIDVWRAKI